MKRNCNYINPTKKTKKKKLRMSDFSEEDWELFRKQIQIMIWGGIIDAVVLGKTPDDAAENRSQQIVDHIRKYIFQPLLSPLKK